MPKIMSHRARKSLNVAAGSFFRWYYLLVVLVTAVALANFVFSVLKIGMAPVVSQLMDTYRAIVHAAFDWMMWPFGVKIPSLAKDIIFVYGVIGGSFMRSRRQEGIYQLDFEKRSLYEAIRIFVIPSRKMRNGAILVASRVGAAYRLAPTWLQMLMDAVLWPRVAIQYFSRPMVYHALYSGTIQTFRAGYTPGPYKEFLHDRRALLYLQALAVCGAVAAILIVNGFLTIPRGD